MELNDLMPDKFRNIFGSNWIVKGKFLMFHHYQNIPIAYIDNGIVYIFLDGRIVKPVIHLIKHLIKIKEEFYFTSPKMSDPSGVYDYNDHIIHHYLFSYSQKHFFFEFRKIENFDFIQNMVSWARMHNCYDLIKSNYDLVNKEVNRQHFDYYSNRKYYEYVEEIREEFRTLYRDIQISLVL